VLTLWQAEWCPYSSAVRQLLTEAGIPFVARPVEPRPEQRTELRERTGTDEIPVLEDEDGRFHRGTDEIFAFVQRLDAWPHARAHRERYAEHREERHEDVTERELGRIEAGGLADRD
jgi:glutaredoxin